MYSGGRRKKNQKKKVPICIFSGFSWDNLWEDGSGGQRTYLEGFSDDDVCKEGAKKCH